MKMDSRKGVTALLPEIHIICDVAFTQGQFPTLEARRVHGINNVKMIATIGQLHQPVEDVRARPEVFPSGDTRRKNPLTYVLRLLASESPRENQEVRINNFHVAATFSESPLAAFTAP